MSKINIEDFINSLKEMNIVEIQKLVNAIKKEFDINLNNFSAGANNNNVEEAKEEKSEFDVILKNFGTEKIKVIKIVKSITNLGLLEAKKLVETDGSVVKEKISKQDAEKIKADLEAAGASVELK